jgi:hypothetical protein
MSLSIKAVKVTVGIDRHYKLISDKITAFRVKTKLDKSFNRSGCWDSNQKSKYITSLIIGQAPSKIIVANIEECIKQIQEDTADFEYFQNYINQGFDKVAIDGNNRTEAISDYLESKVAIQNGTYDLPGNNPVVITNNNNTFKTHPKTFKEHIRDNVMLTICEYIVASREDLSRLFININDGYTLNDQERRNAILVPFADYVRETSKKYEKAFEHIFKKGNDRLKIDEQIVNLTVCGAFGPSHGISKKDKFDAYTDGSLVSLYVNKKGGNKDIVDTLSLIQKYGHKGFKETSTLTNLFMLVCHINKMKIKILDNEAFFKWFMATENKRVANIDRKIVTLDNGTELNYISIGAATSSKFLPARLDVILEDFQKIKPGIVTEVDVERLATNIQRYQCWVQQEGVCPQTGKIIPEDEVQNHGLWEADHVIPYSKGGKTTLDNLELVCRKYNRSKGNKIVKETIAA